jgi:2-dehydro-3-deoxyphosphogluconate aldolase/(4S)-4-hydroxy-2-oxoglutarate aldolase
MKRELSRTASQDVLAKMQKAGVIPVVVIDDPEKAVELGKSILDGGLDLIEITMRTPKAMQALRKVSKELPQMVTGAGTVFSKAVAKEAVSAGARFIVSPHLDEQIVTFCARRDIVCVPGVFTPSEVQRAINAARKGMPRKRIEGLPLVVKIFPAATGGPNHIMAMKAVFPDVRFLPLGGVNADNLPEYVASGAWAVGGTWLCKKELIESSSFDKITKSVKEALTIIASTRNGILT